MPLAGVRAPDWPISSAGKFQLQFPSNSKQSDKRTTPAWPPLSILHADKLRLCELVRQRMADQGKGAGGSFMRGTCRQMNAVASSAARVADPVTVAPKGAGLYAIGRFPRV